MDLHSELDAAPHEADPAAGGEDVDRNYLASGRNDTAPLDLANHQTAAAATSLEWRNVESDSDLAARGKNSPTDGADAPKYLVLVGHATTLDFDPGLE